MKDQNLLLRDKLSLLLLTFLGTGYTPYMPGTAGSLATIPLILLLNYLGISFFGLIILIVGLTLVSCFEAHRMQLKKGVQDPGWIVIDEVIGMLVTWLFIFPNTSYANLAVIFVVFRVFDILKFFPANWVDKKIKNGAGTILDDIISAIYAGIVLYALNYFHWLN